jgi:chromate reductase
MADALNVISICGSLRKGSFNAALQRALPALAPADMKISPAPPWTSFPIYNADDQNSTGFPAAVTTLVDAIRAADGVIFVTPEYNYSIPGGLKNALDWVSRPAGKSALNGKPAAAIGASTGMFGAVWAQAELRKVLGALGGRVVEAELPIGHASDQLAGNRLELSPQQSEQLEEILAELVSEAEERGGYERERAAA